MNLYTIIAEWRALALEEKKLRRFSFKLRWFESTLNKQIDIGVFFFELVVARLEHKCLFFHSHINSKLIFAYKERNQEETQFELIPG